MSFGKKVTEYRERKNMSQAELARRAKMHVGHLNRIEKGTRNPPSRMVTIIKMVEVLGLTPEEANEFLVLAGYSLEDLTPLFIYWIRTNHSKA